MRVDGRRRAVFEAHIPTCESGRVELGIAALPDSPATPGAVPPRASRESNRSGHDQ
jgi:hypothetical protein